MRQIARPEFPDDDGSADAALAAAVGAVVAGELDAAALVDRLASARLLVPVVAVLDDEEPAPAARPALQGDKDSHMAAVLITGRDGRTALLAFSSVEAMARWDPRARPVAVAGASAAQAALGEGAAAMLLDLAGPTPVAVERPELDLLAAAAPSPDDR